MRDDPEVRRAREDVFDGLPTSSRSFGASGTAGRTVPRSGTPRQAALHRSRGSLVECARALHHGPDRPRGQPLVTAMAHARIPYRLAARAADLVDVTFQDFDNVHRIVREVRAEEAKPSRTSPPLQLLADLVVFLDGDPGQAARRKARLDELDGEEYRSTRPFWPAPPADLADQRRSQDGHARAILVVALRVRYLRWRAVAQRAGIEPTQAEVVGPLRTSVYGAANRRRGQASRGQWWISDDRLLQERANLGFRRVV